MRGVSIISAPSELGAGTRGASLGLTAMKVAAWDANSNFFNNHNCILLDNFNDIILNDSSKPYSERAKAIAKTYKTIADEVANQLAANQFPIVVSGDHSNAGGTIAGVCLANQGKRLGVVWIDAHADLHSPYTTPSGNIHGMPLATALAVDNKSFAINQPEKDVVAAWEEMKSIGGVSPKLLPENLVFIGVRDTEAPERGLLDEHNITNHTVEELRTKGIATVIKETMEQLKECDIIYISFDVDSMDSSISLGTGTPVANGLTIEEANTLCLSFASEPKVVAMEITEVNPTLDNKQNKMAEIAFDILQGITSTVQERL